MNQDSRESLRDGAGRRRNPRRGEENNANKESEEKFHTEGPG